VCTNDANRSFYVVFLGGQGKDTIEQAMPKFLELGPKYITTIGICGLPTFHKAMFNHGSNYGAIEGGWKTP
jgi:hypothetical protein